MPIPILQYGVKVRDPATKQFSDLAALRGADGAAGPGLPAGGTDGDVLVKNGATDYVARWTNTPPQMGSLATIETSPATQAHTAGEYIVYNGQLYKVVSQISPQDSLNPDTNGNIQAVSVGNMMTPVIAPLGRGSVYDNIVKTPYAGYVFKIGAICFARIVFDAFSIPAVVGWKEIFTLPYTVSQDLNESMSDYVVTREGKSTQIGLYQNVVRINNPNATISDGDTISVVLPYITSDY